MAPRCGPQMPGARCGAAARAMMHDEVPPISASVAGDLGRVEAAEDAEGAGVGVDETGGDAGGGGEAEAGGGLGGQGADVGADGGGAGGRPVRAKKSSRPMRSRKSGGPARGLVGEVAPLAGEGAEGAGGVAGRRPGEEVGEVEGVGGAAPGVGEVALEPEQLRELHLGRQGAAGVVEDRVGAGGGDRPRLRGGAVVEPEDGVAAVVAGRRGGDGLAGGVAEDERAGGVEGEAGDVFGSGGGLGAGGAEGGGGRLPDLGARTARRGRPRWSRCSSGASARARRRPVRSKRPARALAVPMSTAATSI